LGERSKDGMDSYGCLENDGLRLAFKITTTGAAGIESGVTGLVVPTLNECVTFNWKTGNECFMNWIDAAAMPRVSNPMAHAPSIRQIGGPK
jgi:hypothetical protein